MLSVDFSYQMDRDKGEREKTSRYPLKASQNTRGSQTTLSPGNPFTKEMKAKNNSKTVDFRLWASKTLQTVKAGKIKL